MLDLKRQVLNCIDFFRQHPTYSGSLLTILFGIFAHEIFIHVNIQTSASSLAAAVISGLGGLYLLWRQFSSSDRLSALRASVLIFLSFVWIFSLSSSPRSVVLTIFLPVVIVFLLIHKISAFIGSASFSRKSSIIIFFIALIFRLIWVFAAETQPVSDFYGYDRLAMEILQKFFLVHPSQPLGPPLIFAAVYAIFGHQVLAVQCLMAFMGAVTAFMTQLLTRKVSGSESAAIVAGLVYALWPSNVIYSSLLSSDVPFTLVIMGAVFCIFKYNEATHWKWTVFGGTLLAISHWLRPVAPLFVMGAVLAAFIIPKINFKKRLVFCVGVSLSYLLLISPIAILNYTNYGFFTPVPVVKGAAGFVLGTRTSGDDASDYKMMNEMGWEEISRAKEVNTALMKIAIDRIKDHPIDFLKLAFFRKPAILWGQDTTVGWALEESNFKSVPAKYFDFDFAFQCLLALAAISLIVIGLQSPVWSPAQWSPVYLFSIQCLLVTFLHMILAVQPRYHFPFMPFLALMVGLAFVRRTRSP